MFKPSKPMMARLRLTTKQVNGGYYKGNRTGSMGFFAKNGSYVIDWKKVRTYVVPDNLDQFKLTPFVTKVMSPTQSKYTRELVKNDRVITVERALEGKDYLDMWALDNGPEVLEQERLDAALEKKEQRRAKKEAKLAEEREKAKKAARRAEYKKVRAEEDAILAARLQEEAAAAEAETAKSTTP
ncbi:mitochondrial 54S ribosomal protein mL41 [Aspergillus saccharolyticus JOP 1030-1]|uniref:50S ribosomal protein YmL27 n=1 Tax=Aspergillus saccharolyticus JOP 1030-1 TaxID=1450539 RepID=A0A318ZMK8_9EURO|nr:hypothetical protein BP01DRAFT_360392 [Aspergillus saccharolyticus JOP 1030-1]PYH41418.1 hypothetical protein BP01DRAFT_360392 [Aspergillus saccharolyticus JOP 1030-1]